MSANNTVSRDVSSSACWSIVWSTLEGHSVLSARLLLKLGYPSDGNSFACTGYISAIMLRARAVRKAKLTKCYFVVLHWSESQNKIM